jgi:hypothetical protein
MTLPGGEFASPNRQFDPPQLLQERCPRMFLEQITSLSFQMLAPLSAALVRNPLRRLWPA